MEYNKIYEICQPIMDWLKEHYPHGYKIIIDNNSAELIECGKLMILDKQISKNIDKYMPQKSFDGILEDCKDNFQNKEKFKQAKELAKGFKNFMEQNKEK